MTAVNERLRTLEDLVRHTDDFSWARVCKAESWPVGLVAYHIGRGFDRQAAFIEDAMSGKGPHLYDWGVTHALNAEIAASHWLPSREEVLVTASAAAHRLSRLVGRLSEEEYSRVAFVNGDFQGDVHWLLRTLIPQHADGHLASIAATRAEAER